MVCSFGNLPIARNMDPSERGVVIRDDFQKSPGHTLIIPNRPIGSFFELEGNERTGLLALMGKAKIDLDMELRLSPASLQSTMGSRPR